MAPSQALIELETALATYKKRMATSNRAFWTAKIHALERDESLTDRKRLDILARYFQESKWGTTGHGSSITKPSQLLILPGQPGYVELGIDDDGTTPPAPQETVETFLGKLEATVNQSSTEEHLVIPDEYRHLLKLTDAVSDMDFRQSEEAPLRGTCGGLPARQHLSDILPDQREWADAGWTVIGGWQAGMGHHSGTQLLYARKDDGSWDERQLAWRVYAYDSTCPEGRWFQSIATYLLFKCEWLRRLPRGWENNRPRIPVECGIDTDEESDFLAESDSDLDTGSEVMDDDETDSLNDHPPYQAFDCVHEVFPAQVSGSASLDDSFSALSLEDRLKTAIKKFGSKQQESIHQWLQARLRKIEETSATDPTESQESLKRLAGSFGYSTWSALADEHQLSRPRDLLVLEKDIGQLDTGTRPPVSKQERDEFLERLTTGVNQVYDPTANDFWVVPLPEDYKILLSITDGIRDNDLRGAGVAGAVGVRDGDISKMAPDEVEKLPCGGGMWREGWDMSTGFLLGRDRTNLRNWLVYFYCARSETTLDGHQKRTKDEIKDHERVWKWRVFNNERERFQCSVQFPQVFEDLAGWLQFYQNWWEREIKDYPAWMIERIEITRIMYPRKRKRGKRGDHDETGQRDGKRPESEPDGFVGMEGLLYPDE